MSTRVALDASARSARIAILGIQVESNRFAPPIVLEDFERYGCFEGEALRARLPELSAGGFCERMDRLRSWEPVPILLAEAESGGPCRHEDYEILRRRITKSLAAALPLDAVYIAAHGAGTTTALDDLDGDYFAAVRRIVGSHVPIVATLDLHANVSEAMVDATDLLLALRTNPHLDARARARDAADAVHALLRGIRINTAFVRVPLLTPQIAQLTEPGRPLADLVREAEAVMVPPVLAASILPGFAFSDTAHNGLAVLVASEDGSARAREVAQRLARLAWDARERFVADTITLDAAVELARSTAPGAPRIFADVADNPGGGGRGNTTWILEAFHAAGLRDVQLGLVFDPELVAQARALGEGARFVACFNRTRHDALSRPFAAEAVVGALRSGCFTATRGAAAGRSVDLGHCARLDLGGLRVCVNDNRQQILGAEYLEHFGLDPRQAGAFVLKSRGHFRAGFAHLARPEDIFHVDVPGLTTPNLRSLEWRGLKRPIWPLDPDVIPRFELLRPKVS